MRTISLSASRSTVAKYVLALVCAVFAVGAPLSRAPAQNRQTVRVVVEPAMVLATIGQDQFGVNQPFFASVTPADIVSAFGRTGVGLVRWPGGGGDVYHWRTNSVGPGPCSTYAGSPLRWAQFDSFMRKVAGPLGADVVIGANYGSDAACRGGGDPNEAADWVDYANNVRHYGIKLWTIGNEQWADFAYDRHSPPHDPATYASNVASRYYPLMKARDPSIKIGIDLASPYNAPPFACAGCTSARVASWDPIVLRRAKYDFVDIHIYPASIPRDDQQLLLTGPARIEAAIAATRNELRAAGRPATPIMIGEWNAEGYELGKQSTSIVGALFVGMAGATILRSGVPYAAFFNGFDQSCGTSGADAQLYGWLPYGSWSLFSTGASTSTGPGRCPNNTAFPPYGTTYPAGRALALLREFAHPGERMIKVSYPGGPPSVHAFAATMGTGYALALFNLDRQTAADVSVSLAAGDIASFEASMTTYGKAEYDLVQNGEWAGPKTSALGPQSSRTIGVRLPPWSMNVVVLRPHLPGR